MHVLGIAYGDEAFDDFIAQALARHGVAAANPEKAAVVSRTKQFEERQLVRFVILMAAPPDDVVIKQRIEAGDDVVACHVVPARVKRCKFRGCEFVSWRDAATPQDTAPAHRHSHSIPPSCR